MIAGDRSWRRVQEISADLGLPEPPSPLLTQNCRSTAALQSAPALLGHCQGISSSSRLTPAQSLRRCWESFPKSLPRSPSLLAAGSASAPLAALAPHPAEDGEGEGRWSSAGEGGLKEENNNQKHGERDEMLQKSWPEGNKGAKNNPPKAAMGAKGKLPIPRKNGATLQLPPRCSC